jgi:uncharacterized membrane protein YedE/YeeE
MTAPGGAVTGNASGGGLAARIAGSVFGVGFGFWLCWARFTSYDVILAGLRFQRLYLWLMFGAAVITAAIGLRILRATGARTWIDGAPVAWSTTSVRRSHLLGSAMFGIGWAVAGTCPGPAAAQIGQGHFAGLFTAAGIFAGVALQGWLAKRRAGDVAISPGACAQA